jgi:hypothetical protein
MPARLKGERKEHRDMLKVQRRVGTKCSRGSRGGLSGTLRIEQRI